MQNGIQRVLVRLLRRTFFKGSERVNPVEKENLKALAEAVKFKDDKKIGGLTAADLINALLAEPNKKKRKKMIKEFSERREDIIEFLSENEDLINAEAEAALIGAAVGRKNVTALKFYLKNKMPEKYSDKPVGDTEIEDVSGIEEDLYGDKKQENNSV